MLTDDEIAAMSPRERRKLMQRLVEAGAGEVAPRTIGPREIIVTLMGLSTLALIPWIAYLAFTLPRVYLVKGWDVTWFGFDVILVFFMGATAVFGYLRRQMVMLTAFATGVLLICDAWFDVMMSNREDGVGALTSALIIELPLAFLLIVGASRLLWRVAWRHGLAEDDSRPWEVRIPRSPNTLRRPRAIV
ncbi:MAG: hypothetical protein U0Q21_08980 [Dermatophilaceae bacterium]